MIDEQHIALACELFIGFLPLLLMAIAIVAGTPRRLPPRRGPRL